MYVATKLYCFKSCDTTRSIADQASILPKFPTISILLQYMGYMNYAIHFDNVNLYTGTFAGYILS